MEGCNTKYGLILGTANEEYYSNGNLMECMLDEYNQLKTRYGHLVPKYGEATIRTKYGKAISFYPSGNLKSIYLEQQTEVMTEVGLIPVELITFYEDGGIHRIFPLNGKLTGYWSEEEEYELAAKISLSVLGTEISTKVISIQFYKSQRIKSITLWRKDDVTINTMYGKITTNIGFSLYETGELESIEPKKAVTIATPIGDIKAHNLNAIGIHADRNSLVFYKDGTIKELVTTTSQIIRTDIHGKKKIYAPRLVPSLVSESQYEIEPIKVCFQENYVTIIEKNQRGETFCINENSFLVENARFSIPKIK
jgi:hypothetical protein